MLADGHGQYGCEASEFACKMVSQLIETSMGEKTEADLSDECIKKIIVDAFEQTHYKMDSDAEERFKLSGTTMMLFLIRKGIIYLAWLGDSKAFLASKVSTHLVASMESTEHKPDVNEEAERIEQAGGMVGPFLDPNGNPSGPMRVWNKDRTFPGLATSRSLGDTIGHKLGVSHIPCR